MNTSRFFTPLTRSRRVSGAVGPEPSSAVLPAQSPWAQAGGANRGAYLSNVAIVRGSLTQPKVAVVDFRAIQSGETPDIVLEAEWRATLGLAQKLEEERAQQSSRAPGAIFLRQARFALVLRKLLQEQSVSHIHATSSRALVCARSVPGRT